MPAPEIIHQLVAKFEENREAYRSGKYNEAQLRLEFLDKFFEALGWDIYNRNGYSPEYRDVVIEDSLAIEGVSKSPDYTFKIGKERKFYVEAKKPAVDIQYDIHPAYQLRRYAWNAHLPLSVLTDFEEFAIYNCKNKPNPSDSAATGRDKYYRYTEYVEKWDEIASIFSRDAVWKGSFDRFAESSKGKKGTTEVDDAFLEDIENWRKLLAYNIALRNPQIKDESQMNYAVQMTIDRIIFLRICEDKGIEGEEQLKSISKNAGIYDHLVELFKRADVKYNSGLFHFVKEKGNDDPADTFTPGLRIDDKVLKEIINDIYYPCPYIFKEIPVEILGQVYEQFLGKVIRLTDGHQARIEEKPEVRKAGGVYYTPKYIVDYIVQNTVGILVDGKTPNEVAELKIVDPACGSGSFLLGAYQYLLDWHIKWYIEHDPEKWGKGKNPAIVQASGGGWKLTTSKRKEILVNNIHGVDIDAQAVEVTKLSLLLKVLEEESGQLSLGLERVLPDLGKNIQCGNSLIGWDYFEGQLVVDEEDRKRVNPFDWERAFPQVFTHGGFDAVIGNPPYLKIEEIGELERIFFGKVYKTYFKRYDVFGLFIEKSNHLLNNDGIFGMIIPSNILNNLSFKLLRKSLLENVCIKTIVNLGGKVFEGVTNDTLILIFTNRSIKNSLSEIYDVKKYGSGLVNAELGEKKDLVDLAKPENYIFELRVNKADNIIFEKMKTGLILGNEFACFQGLVTGGNEAYIIDEQTIINKKLEKQICKQAVFGDEIGRYKAPKPKDFVIYLSKEKKLNNFPNIKKHLLPFKTQLEGKREVKLGRQPWYSLHWPRIESNFERNPKILIQAIRNLSLHRRIIAGIDEKMLYADHTLNVIYPIGTLYSLKFILGVLNSNLINFLFSKKYIDINIKGVYLLDIPIPKINFSNPTEVKRHDQMVALVERMLELHKRTTTTPQEQDRLTREIQSTDREIDKLVYELYGLTEEEIKIVEGDK